MPTNVDYVSTICRLLSIKCRLSVDYVLTICRLWCGGGAGGVGEWDDRAKKHFSFIKIKNRKQNKNFFMKLYSKK